MGLGSRPCSGVKYRHHSNRRRYSNTCVAWLFSMATVREAVLVLVVVALASMTITIHLGHHLNPLQPPPNDSDYPTRDDSNHLNVHRSLHLSQQRRGLGGIRSNTVGDKGSSDGITAGDSAGAGSARNTVWFRNVLRVLQEVSHNLDPEDTVEPLLNDHPFRHYLPSKTIIQVERSTQVPDGGRLRVVVSGSSPQLEQDALLVESALRKHSARVTYKSVDGDEGEVSLQLENSNQGRWSVLLCLNTTSHQDACVVSAVQHLPLKPYQKVNVIPELNSFLQQPEILCLENHAKSEGRWLGSDVQCENISSFSANVSENGGDSPDEIVCNDNVLLLVPVANSSSVRLTECDENSTRSASGVAVKLPYNLLTWKQADSTVTANEAPPVRDKGALTADGDTGGFVYETSDDAGDDGYDWRRAMTWKFPVLVTSLSPLRVYLHPEGVVWDGLEAYLQRKPHRGLSLLEIQQMAADRHGDSVSAATVGNLEEGVMNVLVRWEMMAAQLSAVKTGRRSFQLLEATAVFNTTFFPFIIQIGASSLSGHLSSLSEYLMRQTSLNDLSSILGERRNVSSDLAKGLVDLGLSTVSKGEVCNAGRRFCLGHHELTYLLDSLREHSARSGWKRVYPSASAVHFTRLLQKRPPRTAKTSRVQPQPVSSNQNSPNSQRFEHQMTSATRSKFLSSSSLQPDPVAEMRSRSGSDSRRPLVTAELHSLLLGLESFYLRASDSGQSESFEDVNIPIDQTNQPSEHVNGVLIENESSDADSVTAPPCSDDPGTVPYLLSVVTRPTLTLQPVFSPVRTEYTAEVNHTVQLVTVWAWAQNCQSHSRLEDKHSTDRFANFTLGLGSNILRIFVVDTTHDEPWVLNTYTITVIRREADYGLGPLLPSVSHVVCSLKQDCSLPFAPREPCGLQPVTWAGSWTHFLSHRDQLPVCASGDASGQWYVPCTSCREDDGRCYWKEAVWSPFRCKEPVLSQRDLQQCFTDKKVLFIGDSTNRGILHYLLQRVNGSLQVWDKTHHLRVYPALNNNSTLFSFAYYPQFWLPAQHRPVFDKALYQLIRRTLPLDNSSNTVVVVGGVHWLAKHHLKVVQTALAREGLTGAQVIVKGLGSGFHQPVSGVHQLSQKEQEKLLWHNQNVLTYAHQQGMEVVDTFNMTMARYSHFLQGRCTCHFHRIMPQKGSKKTEGHTTYTVDGDINAAYAEMVINRICKPS